MNRKFTRLTALLLAMLMTMSMFSTAFAGTLSKQEYYQALDQMQDDLNLIPETVTEGIQKPISVTSTKLVPVTKQDEGGLVVDGSIMLTAETSAEAYQWQIEVDGVWANIAGENGASLLLTYAMARSALTAESTVILRRLHYDAEGTLLETCDEFVVPVSTEVKYNEKTTESTLNVTQYTQIAEDEQQRYDDAWEFQNAANGKARTSTYALTPAAEDGSDGQLEMFTVTINYVNTKGKQLAEPYVARFAKGASYASDVANPTIIGYQATMDVKPEGVSFTTEKVTYSITNIQANMEINVVYQPTTVDYTVVHMIQNVSDEGYTEKERETKSGNTEDQVPADLAKDYEGFYALLYERLAIAANGSTVVEVRYDRNYYLMKFDLGGGYGVEPIYARYGADIKDIGTPTRPGHTFEGWTLNGADVSALPATMPAENRTYTAKWKMNETAQVSVVFWGENANDEGYSYLSTGKVTVAAGKEYTYAGGELIITCDKEEHTHTAECLNCGQEEHTTHTGACISCTHAHTLNCYSVEDNADLEATTKPDQLEAPNPISGNVYSYTRNRTTYYYLYLDGRWYCSEDTSWLGDNTAQKEITSACSHSHTNDCYTCHMHNSDCYKACGKTEHTHGDECGNSGGNVSSGLSSNLWTLVKSDTVTVNADGSTVINVYYDRTEFTITFKDGNSTVYTIKEKWGADISAHWPIKGYENGQRWSPSGSSIYSQVLVYIAVMPAESFTLTVSTSNNDIITMHYMVETLPGETGETYTYNGNSKVFNEAFAVSAKYGYVTEAEDFFSLEGYDKWTSNPRFTNGQINDDEVYFYYTRHTYAIEFYNPTSLIQKKTGVYYQEPLENYNFTPGDEWVPDIYEPGSVEFDGWYLNPECTGEEFDFSAATMPSATNNGDTALSLYAKWVPVTHTVSFYLDKAEYEAGVSSITGTHQSQTVSHGEFIKTLPEEPDNGEYDFVGWFYMDDGEEKQFDFANIPVTQDMKVYAKWSSNKLMEYTVYFQLEDGTNVADPITGSTLAGQNKTFDAKMDMELYDDYQSGYFPDALSKSLDVDINDPSKNVVYFIYKAAENVPYTVRYINKETGNNEFTVEGVETKYADNVVSENKEAVVTEVFKVIPGYLPDAYSKQLALVLSDDPEDNVITFYYSKTETEAYYKLSFWIENLEGGDYTLFMEEDQIGTIGAQIGHRPDEKISGFTYDQTKTELIVGDEVTLGTSTELTQYGLEIRHYFTRNSYPYVVYHRDLSGNIIRVDGVEQIDDGTMKYGALLNAVPKDLAGYTYSYATPESLTIAIEEGTEPVYNVINIYYAEEDVTIAYSPSVGGTAYVTGTTVNSETLKAATGTAVGAQAVANPGYSFVGWYTDSAYTDPVDEADGTLSENGTKFVPAKEADGAYDSATFYAKFVENTAQLNYVVVPPEGVEATDCGTVTLASETVPIATGTAQGSTAAAASTTYKFVGWYSDAECTTLLSTEANYQPTKADGTLWGDGTTYYAKFDWNVSTLTINKSGMEEGESAIFTVTATTADADGNSEKTFTVVVTNGSSVTIDGVVINTGYTVTEQNSWTWRYTTTSPVTGTIAPTGSTASFTNTKTNYQWLSDESIEVNTFNSPNN